MNVPKGVRGHYPPLAPEDVPRPVHVHDSRLGERVPLLSNSPTQWIATSGMMLRILSGSEVHGTSIAGQGDRDEMGICVEPARTVIGTETFKHYRHRTQPEGVCSGPGDLDLTVYGLRRFVGLAAAGNPNLMLPLFAPESAVLYCNEYGRELRERRDMLISRRVGPRFAGYLHSQRQGLLGLRSGGSNNQGRADLREKHGYDVKFAAHMLRLGLQGIELLETGHITLPMPPRQLADVRAIRLGQRSKEWALAEAERYERRIDELATTSPLPDEPDWYAINEWLTDVHVRFWGLR